MCLCFTFFAYFSLTSQLLRIFRSSFSSLTNTRTRVRAHLGLAHLVGERTEVVGLVAIMAKEQIILGSVREDSCYALRMCVCAGEIKRTHVID